MAVFAKPQTPVEWIRHLEGQLAVQQARVSKPTHYYDSDVLGSSLTYAQEKFREIFGDTFVGWRDNFVPLIVDSISERLSVQGFRFGGPEEQADKDAQLIWQRNCLDADSSSAHINALVQGSSYITVWANQDREPQITPESADEVVVQYRAGSRRELEVAYKQYSDDWGTEFCTLWTPNFAYTSTKGLRGWNDPVTKKNPLKVVPVVPLNNRSRLKLLPYSEISGVIPIADAINKVSMDALTASEFAAYPQRVLSGIEPYENEDDERRAMMKAYIDRIITLDSPDARWGQFDPADLSNYVRLIDMLVQHMASQSRVPFHYFLLNGGVAPSGESITAAEAGLVAKARERMLHFGESWERVMRLAFKVKNDPRAKAFDCETIWADPEHRNKAALADSLVKLKEIGVPDEVLQEKYGFTPTEIKRNLTLIKAQREREAEQAIKQQTALAQVAAPAGASTPGQPQKTSPPSKDASVERQKARQKAA
ncbi:hypothetical protein GCM10022252_19580 [Streptosporangium oxazolinicum]|uniref:Phage portal protein n=1 Tax=Streptosporangium oxazolinicum TaxID=909287 RepID=A0ABP8ANH4_9ACTN